MTIETLINICYTAEYDVADQFRRGGYVVYVFISYINWHTQLFENFREFNGVNQAYPLKSEGCFVLGNTRIAWTPAVLGDNYITGIQPL